MSEEIKSERAVVSIQSYNFDALVLPIDEAVELARLISRAENWKVSWNSETKENVYYCYPLKPNVNLVDVNVVSDSLYQIAKMAGEPNENK